MAACSSVRVYSSQGAAERPAAGGGSLSDLELRILGHLPRDLGSRAIKVVYREGSGGFWEIPCCGLYAYTSIDEPVIHLLKCRASEREPDHTKYPYVVGNDILRPKYCEFFCGDNSQLEKVQKIAKVLHSRTQETQSETMKALGEILDCADVSERIRSDEITLQAWLDRDPNSTHPPDGITEPKDRRYFLVRSDSLVSSSGVVGSSRSTCSIL